MFFYDVETTGIRINSDHIIEIGATVFGEAKSHVTTSSFSQLVYTDVCIPQTGTYNVSALKCFDGTTIGFEQYLI